MGAEGPPMGGEAASLPQGLANRREAPILASAYYKSIKHDIKLNQYFIEFINDKFTELEKQLSEKYNGADFHYVSIDLQFYKTYLESKSRSRELFWGLSGNVFSWEPGNVIIFDSRHIHCSGKMNCDAKLGLSLRFEQ